MKNKLEQKPGKLTDKGYWIPLFGPGLIGRDKAIGRKMIPVKDQFKSPIVGGTLAFSYLTYQLVASPLGLYVVELGLADLVSQF